MLRRPHTRPALQRYLAKVESARIADAEIIEGVMMPCCGDKLDMIMPEVTPAQDDMRCPICGTLCSRSIIGRGIDIRVQQELIKGR